MSRLDFSGVATALWAVLNAAQRRGYNEKSVVSFGVGVGGDSDTDSGPDIG